MLKWILLLFVLPAAVQAQPHTVYTTPAEPSPDALSRLNLKKAWAIYLPVISKEDGVALVQPLADQVFVQLRSSVIVAIDANTGLVQWRYIPKRPYGVIQPVAVAGKLVFFTSGLSLYALNRFNGDLEFLEDLPSTASTGPVADQDIVAVPLTNSKLVGFVHSKFRPADPLPQPVPVFRERVNKQGTAPQTVSETTTPYNRTPSIAVLSTLKPPYTISNNDRSPSISVSTTLRPPYTLENGNRSPSIVMVRDLVQLERLNVIRVPEKHLIPLFTQSYDRVIDYPPIVRDDRILSGTREGLILASSSFENTFLYEFSTNSGLTRRLPLDEVDLAARNAETRSALGAVSAPISAQANRLYVPTAGSNLFAIDINSGRQAWRYPASGGLDRKPFVTDDAVYISGSGLGVTRLDPKEGERVWINTLADQVLAANPKYIYASSPRGNLLILDAKRGTILGSFDTKAFVVPIVNEASDRLYLAANNGLLVCMFDREYAKPVSPLKPIVIEKRKDKLPIKEDPKKEPEPKKEIEPKKEVEPKKEE